MAFFDHETEMLIRGMQLQQGMMDDSFVDYYSSLSDKKKFEGYVRKNLDKDILDALLIEALYLDRKEVANFLVKVGASEKIYKHFPKFFKKDLPYSTIPNNPHIVHIFLDNGIVPTYEDILIMVQNNRSYILQKLVDEKYSNPNLFVNSNALFLTNYSRNERMYHLLVRLGANPNDKTYLKRIDDLNLRFPFQRSL